MDTISDSIFARIIRAQLLCTWHPGHAVALPVLSIVLAMSGAASAADCFVELSPLDALEQWVACETVPNGGSVDAACSQFDYDADLDVDLADLATFELLFSSTMDQCGQRPAPFVCLHDASYNAATNTLVAHGIYSALTPNPVIAIADGITGTVVASAPQNQAGGQFSFEIQGISGIPCRVRASMSGACSIRSVTGVPSSCSSTPGGTEPPFCSILSPDQDVDVTLGQLVVFAGAAFDPNGGPLAYEWDFGGGADIRPLVADPGPISFDWNNGSFLVRFVVTDDSGLRCVSSVTVNVGVVPSELPPMVAQQPAPGTPGAGGSVHTVLPFNDLGMHCADLASDPLSILPPFNTVNAHVIRRGSTGLLAPVILDDTGVELRYSAATNPNDPVGPDSINSTSQNYPVGASLKDAVIRKTDFWDEFDNSGATIAATLFPGLNPLPDEGLQTVDNPDHGRYMPGIDQPYHDNVPQLFGDFLPGKGWFTAQGIPMTGVDDRGRPNSYPLMRVQAVDTSTSEVLATTDVVVPVSSEVDCRDCHTLGGVGADPSARVAGPAFVASASPDRIDVERAAKLNALLLHDFKHGTTFINNNEPVLCASCHRSNALAIVGGPAGDPQVPNMSNVAHGFHGRLQVATDGSLLRDVAGEPLLVDPLAPPSDDQLLISADPTAPMEDNCFKCHPGKITQCFRGAMFTAGQTCASCHGGMMAVGGVYALSDGQAREPWADEPRCGSCHTGSGDQPVLTLAYSSGDPAAEPLPVIDDRFAEMPGVLYRESLDAHAGVACEACHGSPHAIWPNRDPDANDNIPAMELQGHVGPIRECTVCHNAGSFPNGTLSGPHGMHPVNDPQWIHGSSGSWHRHYYENGGGVDRCAPCHGADHLGSRLARVPVDRVLRNTEGQVLTTLKAGEIVSCNLCHSLQDSFGD
ncbi:MAG: hypothetical protein J5J06_14825 [Phycisphaerae bacterium]|nr:hypothetical protein [Phycisphaerae bacterium]